MHQPARRLLSVVCAALAAVAGLGALASAAQAQIPYASLAASDSKYASIVVDANSGEVLFAKSADSQRYPASITKVMTLYLAFEALAAGQLSLDDTITVSPRAAAQPPTKLGLRAGETITVGDAMRAIALKSANDMAVALAEKVGGTESRFTALMTLRARELGMNNSRFVNASGLPDSRQVSTARDIAILSRAVMRDYPQYYYFFGMNEYNYRGRILRTHNHLLGRMAGVDGIKTGFTNASGYNLAASAVRNNRRLIAVVLGGNSSAARDDHVQDLLETGFDVLRRRQRGEVITVAQNLFEPAPTGPVMSPSVQQGDIDQDSAKTAMDEEEDAPRVRSTVQSRVRSVKPEAKPAKAAKAAGDYGVQVGAFGQKTLAQKELKRISSKFADKLSGADAQVDGAGGSYRARFAGLSASEARTACSALKSAGQVCMVIAPR